MIIHNGPLGSLTDSYKWCEVLRNKYGITYLELDGVGSVNVDGIKRIVVPDKGNRFVRGIRFLFVCCVNILFFRGPIIVVFFKGSQLFKRLFPWKRFILDIRTLSVNKNSTIREKENDIIRKACQLYGRISIIQDDLLNELNIDVEHHLLPLGADVISLTDKSFETLKLLYVGTLEGRHIDQTVEGLSVFLKLHPEANITYDIIGEGFNDTSEKLQNLVDRLGLTGVVTVHGRKPYSELKPFFDKCNVGISYVPITPWFDHQPPTKTFEYIMSGLYCMATRTSENAKIVLPEGGFLHDDTPDGFAKALEEVSEKRYVLKSNAIRKSLTGYSWPEIVHNYLEPIIESL